jgi:hypothetical protein
VKPSQTPRYRSSADEANTREQKLRASCVLLHSRLPSQNRVYPCLSCVLTAYCVPHGQLTARSKDRRLVISVFGRSVGYSRTMGQAACLTTFFPARHGNERLTLWLHRSVPTGSSRLRVGAGASLSPRGRVALTLTLPSAWSQTRRLRHIEPTCRGCSGSASAVCSRAETVGCQGSLRVLIISPSEGRRRSPRAPGARLSTRPEGTAVRRGGPSDHNRFL